MYQRALGFAWAGLTVCIFAGWFVVTRLAVTHVLRVWDVTALRFGIGLLCLGPVLFRQRLPPRAWRNSAIFAVLWGAPFVLLLGYGVLLTSATEASSMTPTLTPVFAGLFAWAALEQRPSPVRWAGYAAIIAGVVGLVTLIAARVGPPDPIGILALLAASAGWSVYTLLFRGSGLTAVQSAGLICFWSVVVYLPFYLVFGLSRLHLASWNELLLQGGYQGVLMSAVGIVTFNRAVTLLGPGAATAIIALLPAIATLLAIPVLGEVPGPLEGVAVLVIAAGVLLAARPMRSVPTNA